MALCSFSNCHKQNVTSDTVNYYTFPFSNNELLRKWIKAVNRPNWLPSKTDYVCQYHFSENSFINGMLTEDAVPESSQSSLFLQKTDSKQQTKEKVTQSTSIFSNTCRLCGTKDSNAMADIFDNSLLIFEKISLCLPIVILLNDSLPKQICLSCLDHLDVSYSLLQSSLATQEKLKKSWEAIRLKKDEITSPVEKLPLNGPAVCDICAVKFIDMNKFDSHVKKHLDELLEPDCNSSTIVTCSKCGYLFIDSKEYEKHRALNNQECEQCNMTIQSVCSANTHECPEKFCSFCNVPFQNYKLLTEHLTKNHSVKIEESGKVSCEMCKQTLTTEEAFKSHICVNHQFVFEKDTDRPNLKYECNLCQQIFTKCEDLSGHCVKVHGPSSSLWICKYCGKSMTTKLSLNIHERIHSGTKPFICEWCGNGFRSRANLMQHQVVHTGVRNHACPRCGKKFSRKSFVRTHMRVHTGERPYCCDICGQRFTQVGDMRRHRNRHHQAPLTTDPDSLLGMKTVNIKEHQLENNKNYFI